MCIMCIYIYIYIMALSFLPSLVACVLSFSCHLPLINFNICWLRPVCLKGFHGGCECNPSHGPCCSCHIGLASVMPFCIGCLSWLPFASFCAFWSWPCPVHVVAAMLVGAGPVPSLLLLWTDHACPVMLLCGAYWQLFEFVGSVQHVVQTSYPSYCNAPWTQ